MEHRNKILKTPSGTMERTHTRKQEFLCVGGCACVDACTLTRHVILIFISTCYDQKCVQNLDVAVVRVDLFVPISVWIKLRAFGDWPQTCSTEQFKHVNRIKMQICQQRGKKNEVLLISSTSFLLQSNQSHQPPKLGEFIFYMNEFKDHFTNFKWTIFY